MSEKSPERVTFQVIKYEDGTSEIRELRIKNPVPAAPEWPKIITCTSRAEAERIAKNA